MNIRSLTVQDSVPGTSIEVPASPFRPLPLVYQTEAPSRPVWRTLALCDAVTAFGVLMAFALLWPPDGEPYGHMLAIRIGYALGCWTLLELCLWARGGYTRIRRNVAFGTTGELTALLSTIVIAAGIALVGRELYNGWFDHARSALFIAASFAGCALALPAVRALVLTARWRSGLSCSRALVVGTGTTASDIAGRLERTRHFEFVGFVDDDPSDDGSVLGDLASLTEICKRQAIDRVIVAFPHDQPNRTAAALRSLPDTIAVHVVPPYAELTGWDAAIEDFDGLAVISVGHNTPTMVGIAAKRLLDIVGAVVGLLLLLPFLVLVSLAIRLTSPGPILFRQERIGKHRVPFHILKFRSMREPSSDPGSVRRQFDADAVTGVGKILRRTGFDEIPQLINVLLGHMSLVGPRPLIAEESAAIPSSGARRFDVRPGLTGLWQICGQHELRHHEMGRLDVQYVTTWSFGSDLRILAKTPRRLLRGGGNQVGWHGSDV